MDRENKLLNEDDDIESYTGKDMYERVCSQPLLTKRRNTTSQIAIVGVNACPVESLDYEERDMLRSVAKPSTGEKMINYDLVFLANFQSRLFTGLVGIFNNIAVENISGFKLLMTTGLMLKHQMGLAAITAIVLMLVLVELSESSFNSGRYYKAFAALAGCNLALAAAAAALCAYIAPAAAGSGIPEIFGSILCVSAGFVVGKEGPMVHTGACIASLIGQGGSRKYHLTWKWLRYFKNDRDRRDLITCGAAAGVASAFRAPVGGVLFALEEAASWWRSALLWRTFFTTAVVAIVLRAFIQLCSTGTCGLFGEGGLIMYDVSAAKVSYSVPDILAVILLGVIGGIFGSLYNYLVDKVLRTYSLINEYVPQPIIDPGILEHKKGPAAKILLVVTISLLTSICSYGLPWFATCIPCPAEVSSRCPNIDVSGNYKSFQCPPNHYNDMASLFLNTNDDAIRNLLSTSTSKEFHLSTLFIFFCAVYCLGIITYGIAIPSGLFIPVILAGAGYGRFVGRLFEPITKLDVGLFGLLGAASFLGGTMRMTVSLCVILLELTNDLLMLPLVMLVLLISKTMGDMFNHGVYDQIVKLKGLPYMEAHAEPYMKHLVARDIVSGPLITFSGVEKVGNILHALKTTGHNGFPVIDEPPFADSPELCGLVLRSHLLVLLKGKIFSGHRVLAGDEVVRRISGFDFAKTGSGKGVKLEDLDIKDEDMEMYVDLHPITNASPYTVVETMSLAKAAVLFRQLGLRHMCVVPKGQGIHAGNFVLTIYLINAEASDRRNPDPTRLSAGAYFGTVPSHESSKMTMKELRLVG
ncbi:Chloride channel protein CLC-c [Hibiscus syriacus]|uniref:Chloride channel protein CLC-c n=1 Tax=Hibiscus syriacus TaxID=106335 RepID=A0A6A2WXA3_HIBSY|nr:Chloride channel protein CLC-c [Hibiscus syriacus]